MTPDEVLDRALHILERDGWCQGGLIAPYYDGETEDEQRYAHWQATRNAPVCAVGALNRAVYGAAHGVEAFGWEDSDYEIAQEDVHQAWLRLSTVVNTESIPGWNDDPATSKEDVILAFKRARRG